MNYIKQLEQENKVLKEFVNDLTIYLESPKFRDNQMVNRQDIFLRIREMRNKMIDVGGNPYQTAGV